VGVFFYLLLMPSSLSAHAPVASSCNKIWSSHAA
jgi:hypothetical protein